MFDDSNDGQFLHHQGKYKPLLDEIESRIVYSNVLLIESITDDGS